MNDQRFEYYAFISYSHKDQKWAEWLQRKLESYRLPVKIRQESEGRLPKQIRPVFRDQTDISLGSVMHSLRTELQDSRFLIVICSPNSANSEWVNKEIRHFRSMGRGDRIIPFIVGGTPHASSPQEECYPAALLETDDEPLGASVIELKREQALVKVVARILGLKFDHLWQRHERREKQKRLWTAFIAFSAFSLIVAGLLLLWDYRREKTAYYADYVEEWGIPKGLHQLNKEQVNHRHDSWKIVSQHWHVQSMARVNSSGELRDSDDIEEIDRPIYRQYFLRDNGKLAKTEEYDSNRKLLRMMDYSEDLQYVWFKASKKGGLSSSLAAQTQILASENMDLENQTAKGEIVGWSLEYDEHGRVKSKQYLNGSEASTCDADGVFGLGYTYDDTGHLKVITFLGTDGSPLPIRCGVARKSYQYNDQGFRISTTWLDEHGQLQTNLDHSAKKTYQADQWGNLVVTMYFGVDGKPCLLKDGYAKFSQAYNTRGNVVEQAYFGVDGRPCLHKEGYASITQVSDERGYVVERAFLGVDGKPCLHKGGYAKFTNICDAQGNLVGRAFLDVDGKPCLLKDGYAKFTQIWDACGNVVESAYFSVDGKPCLRQDGYAKYTSVYDARGNLVEQAYFDVDGKPCLRKNSCAKLAQVYDARGNLVEQAYFGVDGKPCLNKAGYAKYTSVYDARGNVVEEAYFGVDGKPCLRNNSFGIGRLV